MALRHAFIFGLATACLLVAQTGCNTSGAGGDSALKADAAAHLVDISERNHHSATRPARPPSPSVPTHSPGTTLISQAVSWCGALNEEHRESCRGACGPGCGRSGQMMGACHDLPAETREYVDGNDRYRCRYPKVACESHPTCRFHDTCLERCRLQYPCSTDRTGLSMIGYSACETSCHVGAVNIECIGKWIAGDKTGNDGVCSTGEMVFSWLESCELLPH